MVEINEKVAEGGSPYQQLILPAIHRLLSEADGSYRCERDLHHHLTACLQAVRSLGLGTRRALVKYEHPAPADYGTGRLGNLDYFFPHRSSDLETGKGTALELNFNYADWVKVSRDVIKLADPRAAYPEVVYLAYGTKSGFFNAVQRGIEHAVTHLSQEDPRFLLPLGLHLIVAEARRGEGHLLRIGDINSPCRLDQICWSENAVAGSVVQPEQPAPISSRGSSPEPEGKSSHYIDRQEAEDVLKRELLKAGIGLHTRTARCMFERPEDRDGQHRCKFGLMPLWGNEIRVHEGLALRSEFMKMVQRLCDSGQSHQRAARAAWG